MALLAFGGFVSVMNAGVLLYWLRNRNRTERRVSGLSLVGAILMYVGLALLPIDGTRRWSWLPLVVDLSCPALLVLGLHRLVRGDRRQSP